MAVSCLAVVTLIVLGLPVYLALFLVAAAGTYMTVGELFFLVTAQKMPFTVLANYTFVVIPMFVLMGIVLSKAGVITAFYNFFNRLTWRIRGNLIYTTIIAATGFAAVSGSSIVSSSVFTRIALPEMIRRNYPAGLSAASIASVGLLAVLIPPSVGMVVIAILTNQSIGPLLIAGIIPGLVTACAFALCVKLIFLMRPSLAPISVAPSSGSLSGNAATTLPILALAAILLSGIYGGIFSPSAAGAVGAAVSVVFALLTRRISLPGLYDSLKETAAISAVLMLIVMSGTLFSRFLSISGGIGAVSDFVEQQLSPMQFLLGCAVVIILLGMLIDGISLTVVALPVAFPISQQLGFDPLWFSIFFLKLIEIGAISPPVGINLFAVLASGGSQISAPVLYRGILPFILIEIVLLMILVAFPVIVTWLPSNMGN